MAKIGQNSEARLVAAIYAGQGFIVVAPNYTGYNSSSLPYHPYLNAEAQASDMIDAMRAARASFAGIGVSAAARLFVTGYSQGGYVALATQRAMQTEFPSEFSVTATSGMSGPYALLQTSDNVFNGNPTDGVTLFLPLLINSAQHSSTPAYTAATDVYEAPYATGIENLLPGTLSTGDLVAQNRLPATVLFAANSQPQGAGAAAFFGNGNLIKSSYRSAYLADYAAQPCDVNAASPLACSPQNGLRKYVLNNDLRSFVPQAPLLLCGGQNDPTVPFYNTSAAASYFTAHGKTGMTVLDLESEQGTNDPYALERLGFATAKAALRVDAIANNEDPNAAVASSYHAGLVAPFCLLSTRGFFQGIPF
jgi:predicted esterase